MIIVLLLLNIVLRLIDKRDDLNYTMYYSDLIKVMRKMARSYTDYEHKISSASRAWRGYEWVCSDDFAQHKEDRHVEIADGNYTGRPPIPLQKKKDRALADYKDELENLRAYELKNGIKPKPEEEIKTFAETKGNNNKGRKRGGRALALQKYIRRIQRQVDEAEEAPDSEFIPQAGRGRPKMSRTEKVRHFEQLIAKAKDELTEEYDEMDDKDRIWHQMHDLKSDRRQLRLALKDPENSQSRRVWRQYETAENIRRALINVNALTSKREAEIKMVEAGIELPKNAEDIDPDGPHSAEMYRRTLEHMIKEQRKINHLEEEAKKLGIDVSKLRY